MQDNQRQRVMVQIFQAHKNQEIYNLLTFQSDYLLVVAVNTKNAKCRYIMLSYTQLDKEISAHFASIKQFFSAINNPKDKVEVLKLNKIQVCERLLKKNAILLEKKVTNNEKKVTNNEKKVTNNEKKVTDSEKKTSKNEEKQDLAQLNSLYKSKIVNVCEENRKLLNQLTKKEDWIAILQTDLRMLRVSHEDLAKKLSRIQQQFKERQYHQRQQTTGVTQMQPSTTYKIFLKSIQHKETLREINKGISFQFKPFFNQFLKHFSVQGYKIKLLKQFKDFYQVSSESPLPLYGKVTIKMKVIQTKAGNIYFGVMNELRRKQKFTCQHKQAISYKLRGGKFLYEDGNQTGTEIPQIKQGDQLSLMIDNSAKEVTWSYQQKFMIKRKLPENMQKNPLYAFVSLHDEGDEIQFK